MKHSMVTQGTQCILYIPTMINIMYIYDKLCRIKLNP